MCIRYCEVCSCHVELDDHTNQVRNCGLDGADSASEGLDLGYQNDCPYVSEFDNFGEDIDEDLAEYSEYLEVLQSSW